MSKNAKKAQKWEALIMSWRKSGQSMRKYCMEQKIIFSTFRYWKNKIFSENKIISSLNSFTEIIEKTPLKKEIEIEIKGAVIKVFKDFDETTLKRSLLILRGL